MSRLTELQKKLGYITEDETTEKSTLTKTMKKPKSKLQELQESLGYDVYYTPLQLRAEPLEVLSTEGKIQRNAIAREERLSPKEKRELSQPNNTILYTASTPQQSGDLKTRVGNLMVSVPEKASGNANKAMSNVERINRKSDYLENDYSKVNSSSYPTIQAMPTELKKAEAEWKATPFADMAGIDIALEVGKMNEKKFNRYSPVIQQKLIDIYEKEKENSRNYFNTNTRSADNTYHSKQLTLSKIQPIIPTLKYLGQKIGGGALGAVEDFTDFILASGNTILGNIADLGGNAPNPVSKFLKDDAARRLAKKDVGTTISENAENIRNVPDVIKKYGGNVAESVGRMAPSILVEMATGGSAPTALDVQAVKAGNTLLKGIKRFFTPSSTTFGLSAAGNAASSGYEKSGDLEKSVAYGAMSGLGEMGTEKLFGGFAGTDIGDSLIDFAVKNKALRKILNFGTEAAEEVIMTAVDPFFQKATVDPNAAVASLADYGEAALGGILLSVVMNAATYPIQQYSDKEKRGFCIFLSDYAEAINDLMPDRVPIKPLNVAEPSDADIQKLQKELENAAIELKNRLEAEVIGDQNNSAQQTAKEPESEFDELRQTAELMKSENPTNEQNFLPNALDTTVNPIVPHLSEQVVSENNKPLDNIQKSGIIESTGNTGISYTSSNEPVNFTYAVVPVSSLTASHDADGKVNANYPQELQPRDRERVASRQQIINIVKNLNPALLGESSNVSDGAPIIGQDGIVESGNGRIIALSEAFKYKPEQAAAYHQYIKDNAVKFGVNPNNITGDSVLVRVRDNADIDRAEFARKANESNISSYSASEIAVTDAKKLTPDMLTLFSADNDGDLLSEDNRDFVSRFINDTVPASERNRYIYGNGKLTQEGLTRIRNAVFQKAYGDTELLTKLSESLEDDTKNLTRTLVNIAPKLVRLNTMIADGTAHTSTLSNDIAEAARLYDNLKSNGMTVDDYTSQLSIDEKSPDTVIDIARNFEQNKRSAKALSEYADGLINSVLERGDPNQISLIDGEDAQGSIEESSATVSNRTNVPQSAELVTSEINNKHQVPIPIFLKDDKDIRQMDLSKYEDGDIIGYNGDGVEFKLMKSSGHNFITSTTRITPMGDIIGANNIPADILQQIYAANRQDNIVAEQSEKMSQPRPNIPQSDIIERNTAVPAKNAEPEQVSISADSKSKAQPIADFVKTKLSSGEKITANELFMTAAKSYGGSMANNVFTPKDAYDAMELGVNQHILGMKEETSLESIEKLLDSLPTQTRRTEGMDKFQQFSTPPTIAYLANYAANITKDDKMLEPSAGIGGIAVFAKKDGAEVYVNELDSRRLEILKQMPFDGFYNEDAEQINNILSGELEPTVIVMNPPFSSSGTRNVHDTKIGAKHIEQSLKLLAPNGRLVAIVGQGMADSAPAFRKWWDDIKAQYNVKANIGIDGKNYNKYGTNFGIQMLVIDKGGATTEPVKTAFVQSLPELQNIMEGIRNDRPGIDTQNKSRTITAAHEKAIERSGNTRRDAGRLSSGISDNGQSIVPDASGEAVASDGLDRVQPRESSERFDRKSVADIPRTPNVEAYESVKSDIRLNDGRGERGKHTRSERGNDRELIGNRNADRPNGGISGQFSVRSESGRKGLTPNKKELTDSIFEVYQPQNLTIKGAKPHPAKISESAAMNAVEPPPISYKPNISQDIINKGILSDVQLEAVTYAGQSHKQTLPNGNTRGFFLGDGTGVGKGRTISGIMLDNFNNGAKKAVWVSENKALLEDAKRDIKALFGDSDLVTLFEGGKKASKILSKDSAILFVTYDTLKTSFTDKGSNFEKITKWLGKDYNGVIAYDEAHNMANSDMQKGKRGTQKPSQKGLAGVEFQKLLPQAKIVYASATGATEVQNLRYAERLGLWGEGTPFVNGSEFVAKIKAGGIAAMELVARDLKAMGVYMSRNISYDDVKYDRLTHKLTKAQKQIYDELARAWQIVLQNVDKALIATNQGKDGKAKGSVYSAFWSGQQRFFNQIMTSMQLPSTIEDMQKQLDTGNSIVIQLVSTNEAAQNREMERLKEQGLELEDFDSTPRDMLMDFIDKSFPVQQYETYIDDDGKEKSRPVLKRDGTPLLNTEMVREKEKLLDKLGSIKVPDSPLDAIINHFGSDMVAESTGRKRRIEERNGKKTEVNIANRKEADIQAFQDGKKRIIIFSKAGGTGKSYHADLSEKNQQHRVHYLLQAGWQADAAVQGFGRSHRSNQASAPTFVLVTTDLKGQNRFISTIAKRLDQLGAMTKGQRQTGSQGLFSSSDNLENALASDVLAGFYKDVLANRIDGINGRDIVKKLGLEGKITDEYGNFKNTADDVRDVSKFLNRILTLESGEQNAVFDAYAEKLQTATEKAMLEGTLDKGLENYKADKIDLNEVKDIREDKLTGAKTKYYSLTAHHKIKPVQFADVNTSANNFMGFYKNKISGSVRAVFKTSSVTDQYGNISDNYRLTGQVKNEYIPQHKLFNWEEINVGEAENLWNDEVKKLPEYNKEKLNLISGAVLPVWDKLPTENVRIYRVLTSDGEMFIGRVIPDNMIDETLKRLGTSRTREEVKTEDLIKDIKSGDSVYLENGWKIVQRRVANENRIEIVGADYKHNDILAKKGVFTERIQYQTRYFIPAEKDTAKILDEVLKISPYLRSESKSFAGDSDVRRLVSGMNSPASEWEAGQSNYEKYEKKEILPLSDIIEMISEKFNLPISTGNIGQRDTKGIFKPTAKTIRTRISNDLPTISHEFAHYFDEKYSFSENIYVKEIVALLNDRFREKYPEKELLHEAVAEFIRVYLQSRKSAENISSDFYDVFRETLKKGGDLKQFDAIADEINKYMTAGFNERIDAAISSGDSKRKLSIDEHRRKIYTDWVDSFAPIKDVMDFVKKTNSDTVSGQNDSYVLATNSRNASAVADYIIRHGMTDLNGNINVGISFIDCVKDVNPKNLNILDRYLVLKHSLEWLEPKKGKAKRAFADDTLQDTELIRKSIDDIENKFPEIKQAAENLYEFQRNMMKNFYVDGGGMTQDFMNYLNELYPNYVPFSRNVNKKELGIKSTFANQRLPIRRAKGSGLEIISPLESIICNVEKAVKFGTRNRVMQTLANYADSVEGIGQFMERVPPDMAAVKISLKHQKKMLSEKLEEKLSADDFTSVTDMLDEVFGDAAISFTPIVKSGKNIVTVLKNGDAQYYQIHDTALYNAVAELSPKQFTGFLKISRAIMNPVKALITQSNPIFAGTNAVRDIQTAYKNSVINNPFEFGVKYLKSFGEILKKSDDYKRYKAIGGGHSSELSANRNLLKKTLRDVKLKDAGKARRLFSTVIHFVHTVAGFNDFIETLPRFTEFKEVYGKTGDLQNAINAADDITTNFKRTGVSGRTANAVFMFSNAQIQGLDKFIRSFTDVPPKERGARILKYLISAVLMTALLSWWNRSKDEKGYENLSSYMKNNYYDVALGDGQFLRMPKSREMDIPTSLLERIIDYAFGDKEAFYDFGGYLANQLIPPMIPSDLSSPTNALYSVAGNTAFGPLFDIGRNKDFKGTPIVSKYMQGLENFEQYNEKTTAPAYWLGQIFNWSPMEADHVISSYTGILGQINRALLPLDGEQRDLSFGTKNKFVADSNYSTDILNRAYDARDTAGTNYKRNSTGENALKYEKRLIVADYISNVSKAINEMPDDKKREARGELLEIVKNWNIKFDETDRAIIKSFNSDSPETYLVKSLPDIKLEKTVNGTKYNYTMSPAEYTGFIDEYFKELDKRRKQVMRQSNLSPEILADRLKEAKSEAASSVREKYKYKFRNEFKKVE